MTTIVVGVEDSFRAEDAVALARDLAGAMGADILAVSAYPFDDRPSAHYNLAMRDALREAAERTLDRLCQPLNQLTVERVAMPDPIPARALLRVASESGRSIGSPPRSTARPAATTPSPRQRRSPGRRAGGCASSASSRLRNPAPRGWIRSRGSSASTPTPNRRRAPRSSGSRVGSRTPTSRFWRGSRPTSSCASPRSPTCW